MFFRLVLGRVFVGGPRQDLKLHVFVWSGAGPILFFCGSSVEPLNCRVRVYLTGPIPFLFGPRQDLKLQSSCFLDPSIQKGDRSHIRCYVCNKFCTGVAVPIICQPDSLHTYPQVHALWACRMCERIDRRPPMGLHIKYQAA